MESISRISSLLETARDLTLEAARDAGPRKSLRPLPAAQIKKLLDSRHEREVLDGLRRVIAMQYAHPPQPTLTFFPAVLKTLSNPYPSTRPLVYNYLVHHAELDADTALLSINTIQKSLSDSNPRVRAMALKTMSGIRVPVISQIVSLAIKKGLSDLSPVVRKVAALACIKCVRLDPNTRPQVEEYIATLLNDQQYYVAGAAVQAFVEVCPDRLDLIHPVYRKLCRMIVDMDEWGQLALLWLMTNYARRCFPRRTKRIKRAATQEERSRDFYEDLEPLERTETEYDNVDLVDPDLALFLSSIQPLLQSRNSAVIVAVARAYLYTSSMSYLPQAIGPLVALLRSPQDVQTVALYNIVQVCLSNAALFVPYARHFLLRSTDSEHIWRQKLEILTLVFPHCSKDIQDLMLAELEHFSRAHDPELVRESVRAIGRCAQSSDATTSRRCLALLLRQIHSADDKLVGEAMEVVRHLIQRSPDEHRKTVIRLAKNLDTLTSPTARASIVWLVGEFAGYDPDNNIAADVLRILVKGYVDEADEVRGQIILLAAKVYLHYLNAVNARQRDLNALNAAPSETNQQSEQLIPNASITDASPTTTSTSAPLLQPIDTSTSPTPHPIESLYQHTMLLARYTPSYSLRDRARLFRALLAVPSSTDLASLLLLAPKPVPLAPSPSEARRDYAVGSASLVLGLPGLKGYESVSEWVEEGREPAASVRDDGAGGGGFGGEASAGGILDRALDAEMGAPARYGVGRGAGKKAKTLDDWLDEKGEDSEESDSAGEEDLDDDDDEDESVEDDSEDDEEDEEEETDSEEAS